jgi:hypothetical protein
MKAYEATHCAWLCGQEPLCHYWSFLGKAGESRRHVTSDCYLKSDRGLENRRPESSVVSGNKFCAKRMDLFKQGNEQSFITTGDVRRVPTGKFPKKFRNQKNHSDLGEQYWTRRNKPCLNRCQQQISHYHNPRTTLAPFEKFKNKNYPYPLGPTYEEIAEGFVVKVNEYPPGKFWCKVKQEEAYNEFREEHFTRDDPVYVYWDYCSLDKQHTISGSVRIKLTITDI